MVIDRSGLCLRFHAKLCQYCLTRLQAALSWIAIPRLSSIVSYDSVMVWFCLTYYNYLLEGRLCLKLVFRWVNSTSYHNYRCGSKGPQTLGALLILTVCLVLWVSAGD